MAHPRHEVAQRQGPMAHTREPGMGLDEVLLADAQVLAVAVDQRQPELPPQRVAERDAAEAAPQRRGESRRQRKMSFEHHVPGERQQRFIRHGQPHDSKDQQQEDRQVPVLRDPREDLLFHARKRSCQPSAFNSWRASPSAKHWSRNTFYDAHFAANTNPNGRYGSDYLSDFMGDLTFAR